MTGFPAKFITEIIPMTEGQELHGIAELVVGFPREFKFDMLNNPSGAGFTDTKRLCKTRIMDATKKRSDNNAAVSVVVYCKTTGRHSAVFRNCSAVVDFVKVVAIYYSWDVEVRILNFDAVSFTDQLVLLQDVDVYLSDCGSSSYYTHVLQPGSVSISLPFCDWDCTCGNHYTARGAYISPGVEHLPVDPVHVSCRVEENKILYDLQPSFTDILVTALRIDTIRSYSADFATVTHCKGFVENSRSLKKVLISDWIILLIGVNAKALTVRLGASPRTKRRIWSI